MSKIVLDLILPQDTSNSTTLNIWRSKSRNTVSERLGCPNVKVINLLIHQFTISNPQSAIRNPKSLDRLRDFFIAEIAGWI